LSEKELNKDVYYTFGRAYATLLAKQRIVDCSIGHDNRLTAKTYTKAFIAGLNDGGINTYQLGYSLSQIVYFSAYEYKTKGYAMVTASHNAKEFNGLKLGTGYSETMLSEEVIAFRELCLSGKFISPKQKGKNKRVKIFDSYLRTILKNFKLKKDWKVVVDASNTTSGMFYPEILHEAGCTVIEQNCKPDGNFPLGVPDPTEQTVLQRLREGVLKYNADLGFAYDADGDRMAVVDENGQVLWMDAIVALFAEDVLDFQPGASIVYNNLCSKAVRETIVKKGGQPVMWITGHSFIKAKIKELNSPFGGELSGHIFFNDNFFGHDDAANASLRLLAFLERKKMTLGEAVGTLPRYVTSPEIKLGLADKIKFDFIKNVLTKDLKKIFKKADYDYIDGVRVDTKTAMVTVRASQNGPYMTVKFETKTKKEYEQLRQQLYVMLKKHAQIDWSQGVNVEAIAQEDN
jgi:phosphomannomutase/phosphoglucomutase